MISMAPYYGQTDQLDWETRVAKKRKSNFQKEEFLINETFRKKKKFIRNLQTS